MPATLIRASLLTFSDDPFIATENDSHRYWDDGGLLVEDGKIVAVGDWAQVLAVAPADATTVDHTGKLVIPGFVDAHVHYPQTPIIAAYGTQLLDWLNTYTFPAEQRFQDPTYAAQVAGVFLDEVLRNGITTAGVFCTSAPVSAEAFFTAAEGRGLRMVAGKVMMDRHAPPGLLDTAQSAYDDSKALIERWHGRGRALYGITPRFAITSTEAQLELAGALAAEYPDTFIQSHISENKDEISFTEQLFPNRAGYADVYAHYGLLRERAVYAHGVHLREDELALFHETGAVVAHCPTSNTFLGSGLLNLDTVQRTDRPVGLALGTDVGGGTSFSMLHTLGEAYKVMQLGGHSLPALRAFYLATLGGARAMGIDHLVGALAPGLEADFVVLDWESTPLLRFRMAYAKTLSERLFVLMTLGDDRAIAETWANGKLAHSR